MMDLKHAIEDIAPRCRALPAALVVMLAVSLSGEAAPLLHVPWGGLSIVVGKTVSIVTPGGGVITGKATGVEPDALVVNVSKTTDPKGYPKGEVRVSRTTLRVLQMRTKGKIFRVLATTLGAGAGLTAGALAAFAIDWNGGDGASAAMFGIAAAGTVVGYVAGNEADRRWTTVEILR